ncbi:MAG: glutathione synthase, partial [Arenicellales bacterium]
MNIKLGIVMDPIGSIKAGKDSSLAMLLAASKRGWELYYMEQGDLFLEGDRCHALLTRLDVEDNDHDWYTLSDQRTAPLDELDIVLMRKDPPVDMEF